MPLNIFIIITATNYSLFISKNTKTVKKYGRDMLLQEPADNSENINNWLEQKHVEHARHFNREIIAY